MTNVLRFPTPAPVPRPVQLPSLFAKQTAVAVRAVLRDVFPACRFSVVTERGSMVSAVRVTWTDGPTEARVEALVKPFEAGRFDSMVDCYEYDRERVVEVAGVRYSPACNYVFTVREDSPRAIVRALRAVLAYWHIDPEVAEHGARLASAIEEAGDDVAQRAAVNAFWHQSARLYVSGGVSDLGQLTRAALADRTRCTFTTSPEA